jgi:AP-3 complex subunit delta-1
MFEKSLNDLVRGIRAHKSNEAAFIGQCMMEIKKELKQENMGIKCNAIAKLIYLQMLGYDISWAAFNIVEVMSSTKFTVKRTGYLAASQCFHEGLDVVMLTTNMIRKDISSANLYDSSLALSGLGCFMTPDLARDLANDVLTLTASSRPYLRKKAIIIMYKVFLKFPDALRPAFQRLKDRLEDPDTGVQCAAVSVICELARKNPRNYLSLAPTFFKLMTSSTNNWMLIKIIKLFGALTPLEPRLSKKLMEPLISLIHSTTAMSLLYECISTVIAGMPNHTASIQLCVSKLRLYIEDPDQNLKYLGLLSLSKILKCQPKAVVPHKDMIMDCLDDVDDSIRLRALDLISGMVSKKTLVEIVKKMLLHCDESESTNYRDEVLSKIVYMCSQNNYQYVTNFEWYITVLVEMTRFEGTRQGHLIAGQMLDVTIRVRDVRPFAVKQMATILENTHLFSGSTHENGICEVLYAAAWITGEFSSYLPNARGTIDALLNPKITALPAHIQAVFVQNIVKLYASILVKAEAEGTPEAVEEVGAMLVEKLPVFMQSGDLEVQERACCILQLMKYIVKLQGKGAAVADELTNLFAEDLNPVAPKAQRKVPIPAGLDLDKWINEPPEEEDDKKNDINFFLGPSSSSSSKYEDNPSTSRRTKKTKAELEEEEEEMKKVLFTQFIVFPVMLLFLFTFLLCCCLLVSRAAPAGSDEQSPLPEASKDLSQYGQEEEGRGGGADHVGRQLHPRVSAGAGGGPRHWSVSSCDHHVITVCFCIG